MLFTPRWEDALTDRQTAAAASLGGRIIRLGGVGSCCGSCTISWHKAKDWQIGLIQLEGKIRRKSWLAARRLHISDVWFDFVCTTHLYARKKKTTKNQMDDEKWL